MKNHLLYTGETVGLSVAVASLLSMVIGLLLGVVLKTCTMRWWTRRKMNSVQQEHFHDHSHDSNLVNPHSIPTNPVYEEVYELKEDIELSKNEAYMAR